MVFMKRYAAKKARRTQDIPNGKRGYRLLVNPYDMHDQVSYWPWSSCNKNMDEKINYWMDNYGMTYEECFKRFFWTYYEWARSCILK